MDVGVGDRKKWRVRCWLNHRWRRRDEIIELLKQHRGKLLSRYGPTNFVCYRIEREEGVTG
jgi:hypothetical protein